LTATGFPAPPPAAHVYSALERVTFGRSALEALPEEVARIGARRVFVVTTRSVAASQRFRSLLDALGASCAGTFAGVRALSPRQAVIEGAAAARAAQPDLLLAVGGGSVIDSCKTILLCLRHGIEAAAQLDAHAGRGYHDVFQRRPDDAEWLRMVAVPTTFSASEYTARGGVTNESTRLLEAFSHPMMMPQAIVNAPEMTLDSPQHLLLATGMKAVDHAVERLTSRHANAYSDTVSALALRYLAGGLPQVAREADGIALRSSLQYGVYLSMAGRSAGVNTGLSHGIGHALGTYAGVAHGDTSCLLLPAVLRWIGDARPGAQRTICEALGAKGSDAGAALAAFIESLGLPVRLRDAGVKREDFPMVAERTLADPLILNCSREVRGAGDVLEILESAW
jgi:maleylacetate reductase